MSRAALVAGALAGLAVLLGARGGRRPAGRGRSPDARRAPDRPVELPVELPVDLALELVAGLLGAGAPVRQAAGLVEAVLAPGTEAGTGAGAGLVEVIALSESSGLPPAALLRARADDLRRDRAAAHSRAVRRLGVQLVLPMGLCLLPAFVLLGVVPVVVDLLGLG